MTAEERKRLELERERLQLEIEIAEAEKGQPASAAPTRARTGVGETILEKGAQGVGYGFIDELSGVGGMLAHGARKAAHAVAPDSVSASPYDDASQAYLDTRNYTRGRDAQMTVDHPVLAPVAEVGFGLLAAPFMPAGAKAPADAARAVRAMLAAKNAAPIVAAGAVTGLGHSEESDALGMLEDAGTGAALAVGGLGLAKGIAAAPGALVSGARSASESMAGRQLGVTKALIKKFGGADKARAVVRETLDATTPAGESSMPILGGAEKIAERVGAIKEAAGAKLDGLYQTLDNMKQPAMSAQALKQRLFEKFGDIIDNPLFQGEPATAVKRALARVEQFGNRDLTFTELRALRGELDRVAHFDNLNIQKLSRDVANTVRGALDEAADAASNRVGVPEIIQGLREGNRMFHVASQAERGLAEKMSSQAGNRMFGLTDQIVGAAAGGAGIMAHGISPSAAIPAMAAVGAKKFIEGPGSRMAIRGLEATANAVEAAPQAVRNLAGKVPEALQRVAAPAGEAIFGGADPDKLAPWAPLLSSAAEKGERSLAVTDFLLQGNDPDYRLARNGDGSTPPSRP